MLQLQAVKPALLLTAQKIMSLPWTKDFLMVGGTNVALQLGHRLSVDIDLFTNNKFIPSELALHVTENLQVDDNDLRVRDFGIQAYIQPGDIKVDLFHVDSRMNLPSIDEHGLRLANLMDVAALKIDAMVDRRAKKDYVDMHFIFNELDPQKCLEHFHQVNPYCSPKSVAFALWEVETAAKNNSEMPQMLLPFNWDKAIKSIQQVTRSYAKILGVNIDLFQDGRKMQ